MDRNGKYEDIYQEYLELQARVTKFAATQQELINTKDLLDQELVRYKRLNQFFSRAIRQSNLRELLHITAEAIIDIFELQIGYLRYEFYDSEARSEELIFCEGAPYGQDEKTVSDFKKLESVNIFSGNFKKFESEEIELYVKESRLSFALLSKKLLFGPDATLIIGAGVDCDFKHNYSTEEATKISLFTIFVHQIEAILNNLITLNKNKEQFVRIKNSELELKKLSLIATSTHNAVIITDKFGRIEWVNKTFTALSGYELNEVKGRKPKDFLQVQDDRTKEARLALAHSLAKCESVEVEIINIDKSGHEYYIKLQITPVLDDNGNVINFIALQKDITEEVRQRKELEKMNFRLNEITKGSKLGVWEFYPSSLEGNWNEVLYDLYEVDPNVKTDLHQIWKNSLHPEDKDRIINGISDLVEGRKQKSIEEYRVIIGPSKKLKYVRTIAFPEIHDGGELKILGSTTDITEAQSFQNQLLENNAELKKINNELDHFVYSVSHDLRAPLLSVKGLLTLIHLAEGDQESEHFMHLINKSIDRLDETVLEILEYSRNSRKELEFSSFDLSQLIKEVFANLKHLSDREIDLRIFDQIHKTVFLDKKRVEKVLFNVIGNSIKYRDKSKSNPFVHVHADIEKDHYILKIIDNGEGISFENQKKVFDMFYRASVAESGTGLGLYLCKELVSKMGGDINLTSERGEGTILTITLPKSEKHEAG